MTCTKAQLLALLLKIKKEVKECDNVECINSLFDYYITLVEEGSFKELEAELI